MADGSLSRIATELEGLKENLLAVVDRTRKISAEARGRFEQGLLEQIEVFGDEFQNRIMEAVSKSEIVTDFLAEIEEGGSPLAQIGRAVTGRGGRKAGAKKKAAKANKKVAARKAPKSKGAKKTTKTRGRGVRVVLSRTEVEEALAQAGGVKSRAAEILRISTPTFNRKLDEYGIKADGRTRRGANKAAGSTKTAKKAAKKKGKPGPKPKAAKKKGKPGPKPKATKTKGKPGPKPKAAKKATKKSAAKKSAAKKGRKTGAAGKRRRMARSS